MWRGARYRTQVARAHTAIRRGEEDTNEARKRRDKRDREIEARVGDWPRETERDRRRVRQRVNELFFRRLLALFYSGLIPRERRRSAHRRSIDATIATTIVARAHLRASLSRRPVLLVGLVVVVLADGRQEKCGDDSDRIPRRGGTPQQFSGSNRVIIVVDRVTRESSPCFVVDRVAAPGERELEGKREREGERKREREDRQREI